MSDITISYKGSSIATMDASGTKTLLTEGKYCEDDITVDYVKSGGGEEPDPELKDVVFVDYDGTVVYNYTKAEFLALDAMPSNPSHTGLTAQGWNATLSEAQSYVRSYGTLCIGQNYTTSDGKTKVYITVTDSTLPFQYGVMVRTSAKGCVTIEWGDGDSTVTDANANADKFYSHVYSSTGDYVIAISCAENEIYNLGYAGANRGAFYNNSTQTSASASTIKKVHFGDRVNLIRRSAFYKCYNLAEVSIPKSLLYFGESNQYPAFYDCFSLKCVVYPTNSTEYSSDTGGSGLLYLNNARFVSYAPSMTLERLFIAQNVTSGKTIKLRMITTPSHSTLDGYLIYTDPCLVRFSVPGTFDTLKAGYCREATKVDTVIVPSTITTINDYAMTSSIIKQLVMKPTTPPTISNTRGMPGFIEGITKIIVPYSADHSVLTAYQNDTSWSAYASYMEEASAS